MNEKVGRVFNMYFGIRSWNCSVGIRRGTVLERFDVKYL